MCVGLKKCSQADQLPLNQKTLSTVYMRKKNQEAQELIMFYSVWPCFPSRTSPFLKCNNVSSPHLIFTNTKVLKETFSAASLFPKSVCTKYDQSSTQTECTST